MGKNIEQLVIGEVTYETAQFAPMRALTLLAKMLKTLGGAVIALASAGDDVSIASALDSVQGSLTDLEPEAIAPLVCAILSGTTATMPDSEKGLVRRALSTSETIDTVFMGKFRDLFMVIGHALRVNYANFNVGNANGPTALPTPAPSAS